MSQARTDVPVPPPNATRAMRLAYAATQGLDSGRIPRHVAIIMDGNGRWARKQGWLRTRGHEAGAEVVRRLSTDSARLGIEQLTLYAFSSENWSRPQPEVLFLMRLLERFLRDEEPTLMENNIRLDAIGQLDRLPAHVRNELERLRALTANNTAMTMTLALSYGGRDELSDAVKAIATKVARGELNADAITPATVQAHLYAPKVADVDVVIRTAGEMRLSNFLPWQSVYAEYISVPALFPDFSSEAYLAALKEFQSRARRFGGVNAAEG